MMNIGEIVHTSDGRTHQRIQFMDESEESIDFFKYNVPHGNGFERYYSGSWFGSADNSKIYEAVRKIHNKLRDTFQPRKMMAGIRPVDWEGVILCPQIGDETELDIKEFYYGERFLKLISPEICSVRVNTSFGDFIIDRQHKQERRKIGVIGDLRIPEETTKFYLATVDETRDRSTSSEETVRNAFAEFLRDYAEPVKID